MRSSRVLFVAVILIAGLLGGPDSAADGGGRTSGYSPLINGWILQDKITGHDWLPNSTVAVTLSDSIAAVKWADPALATDGSGWFSVNVWPDADLVPGDVIEVVGDFGGGDVRTRTLTLADLAILSADSVTDVVTGTGPAGMPVRVGLASSGLTKSADNSTGSWSVDLTDTINVPPSGRVVAYGDEGDGDETVVDRIADAGGDPWFFTSLPGQFDQSFVEGFNWAVAGNVDITVKDSPGGSSVLEVQGVPTDSTGHFHHDTLAYGVVLIPGMEVLVTDGVVGKEHTIQPIVVTDIDWDTDVMSGTAPPFATVRALMHYEPHVNLLVVADSSGDWSADFGAAGADIVWGDDGAGITAHDDWDGDESHTMHLAARPRADAWPQLDRLVIHDWQPGQNVTIDIRTGPGGAEVYWDEDVLDGKGELMVDLPFDLDSSHFVSVTSRIYGHYITRRLAVADLAITGGDAFGDTVSGTAPPGTTVTVEIKGIPGPIVVVASGGGKWTADFSGMIDITWGDTAFASIYGDRQDRIAARRKIQPECRGVTATHWGDAGDNVIVGSPGNDVIVGFDGNDEIDGGAGNDLICGDNGNDVLIGGVGHDEVWGGDGKDRILGGDGKDYIYGEGNKDNIKGGRNPDRIWGGMGDDKISAGPGDDEVQGQKGDDLLIGQRGQDILNGGAGTDDGDGGPHTDICYVENPINCELPIT